MEQNLAESHQSKAKAGCKCRPSKVALLLNKLWPSGVILWLCSQNSQVDRVQSQPETGKRVVQPDGICNQTTCVIILYFFAQLKDHV